MKKKNYAGNWESYSKRVNLIYLIKAMASSSRLYGAVICFKPLSMLAGYIPKVTDNTLPACFY
jgi:hypothetical protein